MFLILIGVWKDVGEAEAGLPCCLVVVGEIRTDSALVSTGMRDAGSAQIDFVALISAGVDTEADCSSRLTALSA